MTHQITNGRCVGCLMRNEELPRRYDTPCLGNRLYGLLQNSVEIMARSGFATNLLLIISGVETRQGWRHNPSITSCIVPTGISSFRTSESKVTHRTASQYTSNGHLYLSNGLNALFNIGRSETDRASLDILCSAGIAADAAVHCVAMGSNSISSLVCESFSK